MNGSCRRALGAAGLMAGCAFAADPCGAQGSGSGATGGGAGTSLKGFFSGLGHAVTNAVTAGDPVVRGHFDIGNPPRRYYCVVNAKTGAPQPNAVEGALVPRADGTTAIQVNVVSLLDCGKIEQKGMLVTVGYTLPTLPGTPSGDPAAVRTAASAAIDTKAWNILGVKPGMSAEAAEVALRGNYPKIVRVDHEVRYKLQQFATPPLVLGTQYVAGNAYATRPGPTIAGAHELGNEAETVDIEYVWPAKGAVAAVRREHFYDTVHPLDPRTLPSVDSIQKGLIERFGPPTATSRTEGTGVRGNFFVTGMLSTITWTWTTSPAGLRGDKPAPQCDDARFFYFSSRDDAAEIGGPDQRCGTFLTATVDIVDRDYARSLTEDLVDSRALDGAYEGLRAYLTSGAAGEAATIKAHADRAQPKL